MSELPHAEESTRAAASDRTMRWDAIGVIIASLVGLLALLVSGYTAWIQRQQVRAQVWPYLTRAYVDPAGASSAPHSFALFNKGVGPALIRSVEVTVDGVPQTAWSGVFDKLGLSSMAHGFSSINGNVLSAGETLPFLVFSDKSKLMRFRQAMSAHGKMRICYCSTLGECWMFADREHGGEPGVQPKAECPRLSPAETFQD